MISMDPNRSELLVQSWVSTETFPPIWVVPILGGTPRRFGKVQATDGAFSPDGRLVHVKSGLVRSGGERVEATTRLKLFELDEFRKYPDR